jgi:uncharacterized small protein (DUF1192 family)
MSSYTELERQEIVQATLEKAFKKFVRKGLISQDQATALSSGLLENRQLLIQAEVQRLQAESTRVQQAIGTLGSSTRATPP